MVLLNGVRRQRHHESHYEHGLRIIKIALPPLGSATHFDQAFACDVRMKSDAFAAWLAAVKIADLSAFRHLSQPST